MQRIKETLNTLINSFSVSGHELYGLDAVKSLAGGIFDEIKTDKMGSILLIKRSNKPNAKKLLIDAHYDTVGMMVTSIKKDGFLSFCSVGGLDTSVLPSTEVIVRGKENVYGIITSTPPHLSTGENKSPKIDSLYIDTGYSKEKAEELISVGDPVTFKNEITYISGDYVISPSLDDKSCLCAIFDACANMSRDEMEFDVYVTASAQEETGKCGVARVAFDIEPDLAIITDVNFAKMEKDESYECLESGKGASIDISAVTDRKISKNIMKYLTGKGIEYQVVCEPRATSTNADFVSISGNGIKTVLMSIPLKSMHTPSESVCLRDIKSLSSILLSVAYNKSILD